MKNLQKITLAALLFAATAISCSKDFLDIKPQGKITSENYFANADQAVAAVNAIYAHIRYANTTPLHYLGQTDMVSDDADKGSEPNDAAFLNDFDFYNLDPGHTSVLDNWQNMYRGIFRANNCIQNLPKVPGIDPALQARLLGEAKFLRAHFYFNLVRWYGDVPLVVELLDPAAAALPRSPATEVYALIVKDLKDAIEALPERSQQKAADLGRATKGSARGYLARVCLTLQDYVGAEKYARDVVNSNEYALLAKYQDEFMPGGELSAESVFEVGAKDVESWDGRSEFNMVQGVRGVPNLGWGFNRPSDDFVKEFENGDPRREATVLYVGEVLPDGSTKIQDNPLVVGERYNQKAWTPPHLGLQDNGPGNLRLLRYSEVLLILAEALNEQGKSAEALPFLNQVRKRARGTNGFILPDVTTTDKAQLRQKIWHERRVELGMEQHRWFDLVRMNRKMADEGTPDWLADRMHAQGRMNFVAGKHELMPIPQSEIDLSGGRISQNFGY